MDNGEYVGLSRQTVLRRQLDVIANDVANTDTAGFKVESLIVQTDPQKLASAGDGPGVVNFVLDAGVARNFGQGALKPTGAPFDMAIEGEGFFKIQTPDGERYTRDGRFAMDANGRLVSQSGQPLQGDGGDLTIDATKGPVKIAADGAISQGNSTIGKVAVVNFASLSALAKDGDGLYRNVSNIQPTASTTAKVVQGMVEGSNVDPISQITKMIEVSRAYESITNMMTQTSDLSSQTINRLGKLN